MRSVHTRFLPILITTAALEFSALHSYAQGALTPPGAPAPMMKTLSQMEPRTAITNSGAVTISQPGSYYLTTNITVSTGTAITIATNCVTLDLNGFAIISTAATANGNGIAVNVGLKNIAIMNGFVQGGVTNNGSGVYSGPGFSSGISFLGLGGVNARVHGVSVSGCMADGIVLNNGDATVVESCTVRTVGSRGLSASSVRDCVAVDCGADAIYADQVFNCRGQSTGSGYGIFATIVQNSYGLSVSGIGISAAVAQNSSGTSTSADGLYATEVAMNCYGSTSSGTAGLHALNASFCVGNHPGSTAVEGSLANGCLAATAGSTNNFVWKYNMP